MAQLYVLPESRGRILQNEKSQRGKARNGAQAASNLSTYATPRATGNTLTLGNISSPYEIFEFPPSLCLGEGSWTNCIRTWGNAEKQISEMPTTALVTQEDDVKSSNIANAPRFADGGPLSRKNPCLRLRKDV